MIVTHLYTHYHCCYQYKYVRYYRLKAVRLCGCILRSPTAIVAMLNDRTAELIGQSENHYSTVFLT